MGAWIGLGTWRRPGARVVPLPAFSTWSATVALLVLRDLLLGRQYFDQLLAARAGIATNVLAERLKRLQRHGLIEMAVDCENRQRKRYTLTDRGRSFGPVLEALARWGLEHVPGARPSAEVQAALARRRAAARVRTKAGSRAREPMQLAADRVRCRPR